MKQFKKLVALMLCLCMVFTVVPMDVLAGESAQASTESTTTSTESGTEAEATELEKALAEAKAYIDALTINNSSNDPYTVVKNFGTHFTWDNEKRENGKSYLFDWSYYNGVVFEGLEYVYEVTGETVYKDYVIEYLSSMINTDGSWATCSNNINKECAGYDATHGADCYKTASLLLDAYAMTDDSRYLTMAATLYADLTTAASNYSLANAGNNWRHTWASDPSPDLWLDGLYMILPFRAEYAKHINDTDELTEIVSRLQWVSDNMYNEQNGLFYHAADSASSNSGTHWLRSIGWYAAAIVDVMDSMSGDNLETMKKQLVKLVDGMKACQNASNGMWLNNMAASQSSTNPYETSGTALVCYAVMKAVNNGWLDASYADMALLAFQGICNEKLDGTTLKDICFKGTPGDSNSTFYDNEGKGVGPFIMFYAEVLEYSKKLEEEKVVQNGITVTAPTKVEYTVGEAIDLTGLVVKATMSDGTTGDVVTEYTVSDVDMTTAGEKTVTVTAGEFTATFTVTVKEAEVEEPAATQTGITVTAPTKVEYVVGETLDLTGMVINQLMSDGTTGDVVTEYTVSDVDMTTTGEKTVTVTAGDFTATFTITVEGLTEVTDKELTNGETEEDKQASATISGTVAGVTSDKLSDTDKGLLDAKKYANYVALDIAVKLFEGEVTITMPVPAAWAASGKIVGVSVENGEVKEIEGVLSEDKTTFSFKVNHFSAKGIALVAETVAEDGATTTNNPGKGNLVGGTTYTYELATSITSGEKYLIVSGNNGTVHILTSSGASKDIELSDDGYIIVNDNSDIAWEFNTTSNYGSTYWNVEIDGRFVRLGSDVVSDESRNLTISNQTNGAYRISYTSYGWGSSTYYLNYNNGWDRTESTANVYLYKLKEEKTSSGEEVIFEVAPGSVSLQPNGTQVLTGTVTVAGTEVDLSDCTITWVSSDTTKATVSNGTVTGVADGTANITATLSAVDGVALQTPIVLEIPVTVQSRKVTGYTFTPGQVTIGASTSEMTGGTLTITYDSGDPDVMPNISVGETDIGNNINNIGTHTVNVTYNGVTYAGFTLKVVANPGNNYPEFPDEGSVTVDKVATGIDFQSSGIAKVELSATGVPKQVGVDVVLTIDVSNSMAWETNTGNKTYVANNKLVEVMTAVKNFATIFLAPNEDGTATNNTMTIVIFGGYDKENWKASESYIDSVRTLVTATSSVDVVNSIANNTKFTNTDYLQIAYVDANGTIQTESGSNRGDTNYDYAFWQTEQAINGGNLGAGDREVHVLFMTDGCASQFNNWQYRENRADELYCPGTQNNYSYINNATGETWISKIKETITANGGNIYAKRVYEKIDGMYAVGFDMKYGSFAGITNWNSEVDWEATFNDIVSEVVTDANGNGLIPVTAASDTATLNEFYTSLANELRPAATNSRFVDKMGLNFSLLFETKTYTVVNDDKTTTDKTFAPVIEIFSYDVYTQADAEAGTIPTGKNVGDRKGTRTLLEVVAFSEDGTAAYSNLIGNSVTVTKNADGTYTYTIAENAQNILTDGVINASTFWYNTTSKAVAIDGVDIPTSTNADGTTSGHSNLLPAETFYWKIGTLGSSELAISYYVYLDGSMEGSKEAGSYATNEFAILYYDNLIGNPVHKDTVSPNMAWKEANVSYAFYLVDKNGNIVVNQTTGATGSFANKIAVTRPVVHSTIFLNNLDNVKVINVASGAVLPEGYKLYDATYDANGNITSGATYKITINSNTTGSWAITSVLGTDAPKTTYVMQYDQNDAAAYSNEMSVNAIGNDYTHTVVWFAVVWEPQALPDQVVIDYGLPVDISVMTNDMFGTNGKLIGVGALNESLLNQRFGDAQAGFAAEYTGGKFGKVTMDAATGKVRYTPTTMAMNGYDKFMYAVAYTYTNTNNVVTTEYYYSTVTVIPATTIYYEDDFLTFEGNGTVWEDEGTPVVDALQAEDRPGKFSLTDADNIYGYDSVNLAMSKFSLGTAKKVHVDATSYAKAKFTFAGTGFDVISMTSNTTGVLAIKVTAAEEIKDSNGNVLYAKGAKVKAVVVDTYYGYAYENGQWVAKPNVDKAVYQVPVMQVENLTYAKYNVEITATYMANTDQTTAEGYDLYLDAVRIYDPANDGAADNTDENGNSTGDTTIEDAYVADGEGWPSYIELRNKLIAANSFDGVANDALTTDMEGLVFIDGDASVGNAQLSDYISYGPNNEVYLAPGQRVAFILSNINDNVANIHIGIKSADGKTGTYTITNIAQADSTDGKVKKGDYYNPKTYTINTTTDMYYDLTAWKNDIIVISNTGDRPENNTTGVISLTNIKVTYKTDPNGATVASAEEDASNEVGVYMTAEAATLTLRALNRTAEPEEPEVPAEPEVFETEMNVVLSSKTVKQGNNFIVTVTTGTDVASLSINGVTLTHYTEIKYNGTRIWVTTIKAEELGEMNVDVIAYNADGIASAPATETITVAQKSSSLVDRLLGWLLR